MSSRETRVAALRGCPGCAPAGSAVRCSHSSWCHAGEVMPAAYPLSRSRRSKVNLISAASLVTDRFGLARTRVCGGCGQQVRQYHGVEPAHHHQDRPVTRPARVERRPHVEGHLGLPLQGSLGSQVVVGVVEPSEPAVRRDPGHVLLERQRRGFEEPLPEVLVVTAAQSIGQQLEGAAVREAPLVEQRPPAVVRLRVALPELRLHREVEVDEVRRDPGGDGFAQGHELRAVVAERVVGAGALPQQRIGRGRRTRCRRPAACAPPDR